jgi:hypothetical protein
VIARARQTDVRMASAILIELRVHKMPSKWVSGAEGRTRIRISPVYILINIQAASDFDLDISTIEIEHSAISASFMSVTRI